MRSRASKCLFLCSTLLRVRTCRLGGYHNQITFAHKYKNTTQNFRRFLCSEQTTADTKQNQKRVDIYSKPNRKSEFEQSFLMDILREEFSEEGITTVAEQRFPFMYPKIKRETTQSEPEVGAVQKLQQFKKDVALDKIADLVYRAEDVPDEFWATIDTLFSDKAFIANVTKKRKDFRLLSSDVNVNTLYNIIIAQMGFNRNNFAVNDLLDLIKTLEANLDEFQYNARHWDAVFNLAVRQQPKDLVSAQAALDNIQKILGPDSTAYCDDLVRKNLTVYEARMLR